MSHTFSAVLLFGIIATLASPVMAETPVVLLKAPSDPPIKLDTNQRTVIDSGALRLENSPLDRSRQPIVSASSDRIVPRPEARGEAAYVLRPAKSQVSDEFDGTALRLEHVAEASQTIRSTTGRTSESSVTLESAALRLDTVRDSAATPHAQPATVNPVTRRLVHARLQMAEGNYAFALDSLELVYEYASLGKASDDQIQELIHLAQALTRAIEAGSTVNP